MYTPPPPPLLAFASVGMISCQGVYSLSAYNPKTFLGPVPHSHSVSFFSSFAPFLSILSKVLTLFVWQGLVSINLSWFSLICMGWSPWSLTSKSYSISISVASELELESSQFLADWLVLTWKTLFHNCFCWFALHFQEKINAQKLGFFFFFKQHFLEIFCQMKKKRNLFH